MCLRHVSPVYAVTIRREVGGLTDFQISSAPALPLHPLRPLLFVLQVLGGVFGCGLRGQCGRAGV